MSVARQPAHYRCSQIMSLICRCHRLITAIIRQQSLSTHIIYRFTRTLCPVRNDVTKELIQTIQHGSVCWPLDLCLRGSLFLWQQSGNNIHTWTKRHILKRWTYLKLTFWYLERQAEFKNVCEDLSNLQTLEHLQEDKSVNSEYYHLCFFRLRQDGTHLCNFSFVRQDWL